MYLLSNAIVRPEQNFPRFLFLLLTWPYTRCVRKVSDLRLDFFLFACESVVHYEFAPRGHTVNEEYYVKVLKRLRDTVIA